MLRAKWPSQGRITREGTSGVNVEMRAEVCSSYLSMLMGIWVYRISNSRLIPTM